MPRSRTRQACACRAHSAHNRAALLLRPGRAQVQPAPAAQHVSALCSGPHERAGWCGPVRCTEPRARAREGGARGGGQGGGQACVACGRASPKHGCRCGVGS